MWTLDVLYCQVHDLYTDKSIYYSFFDIALHTMLTDIVKLIIILDNIRLFILNIADLTADFLIRSN